MAPFPLTLVVLLYPHPGRQAAFEAYEAQAVRIMARYGGRIERRVAPFDPGPDQAPGEVHIVTFPDRSAFERYRTDPDLTALAPDRQAALRETVIWFGNTLPPAFP